MTIPTAGRLHGELEGSGPLHSPDGRLSLRGWCLIEDLPAPPEVRLVTDTGALALTGRHARTDVQASWPGQPAAAQCGFTFEGRLPDGVHLARLEVRGVDGSWRTFREFSITCGPVPFAVVIDDPHFSGTLRDRIKVGGWALHPREAVAELVLRYGHREVACSLGRPRADVPRLYPAAAHAPRSGFVTSDFLVAGYGPVRGRARLRSGRTVAAPAGVTFGIATDEYHGPELNLEAPRPSLGEAAGPAPEPPPARAARPLNLCFILPGSFAANHALHVAALANQLAGMGHACVVTVAHDVDTLAHHQAPAFRGLLHAAARENLAFPDGRGPDVIHAWTTRENVRALADELRRGHSARLVVHLEDNEQQILAQHLGLDAAGLAALPPAELARRLPADQSHPQRSRDFLAGADGITVIMDRLREFAPTDRPCLTLSPAADARYFFPRPRPKEFRAALDVQPGEVVIFYHGNVHPTNAAEVRELYAAVLELNRGGQPTTLIRTGLDTVDFLGALAPAVHPHVLSLGQILHHHHLPRLMALADYFVQPGRPDAFNDYRFPSKLPEFFALGRPVILPQTNLGAQLRHGVDAYVLAEANAAGIAGAIREMQRDRGLYERLSRGATELAASRFSWRRSAEALANFYGDLKP